MPEQGNVVQITNVRVIDFTGDVSLADRLLQCALAVRGSHSLLRCPQVRPVLQSFRLKVVQVALDGLVIECPSHVIVRCYRFVSQQLPQIREPLNPGELRGGYIGLELKHLQFDLQQIALADVACFVSRFG